MDVSNVIFGSSAVSLLALAGRAAWRLLRSRSVQRDLQILTMRHQATAWVRDGIARVLGKKLRRAWLARTKVQKYIDTMLRSHLLMTIPGHSELPLKQCYVPMDLRAGHVTTDTHLSAKVGSVLLVGATGSGKSALLSRLLHHLCWQFTDNNSSARLPVFTSLQQLQKHFPEDWDAIPEPDEAFEVLEKWFENEVIRPLDTYDPKGLLSTYAGLERQGLVVLLDGLDELSPDMLQRTHYFLVALKRALAAARGNNLLVVATREQALEFIPEFIRSEPSVSHVSLDPFSDSAIYSFISRWLYYQRGPRSESQASRVFAALKSNLSLLDVCRSPLVLALYMERYYGHGRPSEPNGLLYATTRAGFFRDVLQHLIVERRASHTDSAIPNYALSVQRLQFFVEVAKNHIDSADPYNQIAERHLLLHAPGIGASSDRAARRDAIIVLAKDTGILDRSKDGTWRFTHPAFLDYFVACALIQQTGTAQSFQALLDDVRRSNPRLTEALYFTFGLMAHGGHIQLDMCMGTLAKNARMAEHYPRVCLETQHYNSPGFVRNLSAQCAQWNDSESHSLFPNRARLRTLAQVLYNRELLYFELGTDPGISVASQFGRLVDKGDLSIFDLSGLEIEIAKHLAGGLGAVEIVQEADPEDALSVLYDEDVVNELLESGKQLDPATARFVAEIALRSDLIARILAPETLPPWKIGNLISMRRRRWSDAWPIRDSEYGRVLEQALTSLENDQVEARDLPRLSVLAHTRPFARFSSEMLLGRPSRSFGFLVLILAMGSAVHLMAYSWTVVLLAALSTGVAAFLGFRLLVLRGVVGLDSTDILNRYRYRPFPAEIHQSAVKVVRGTPTTLPKVARRLPAFAEGPMAAAYFHVGPMIWWRYSPQLGDARLTLHQGALLMSMWTEEIRRIGESV